MKTISVAHSKASLFLLFSDVLLDLDQSPAPRRTNVSALTGFIPTKPGDNLIRKGMPSVQQMKAKAPRNATTMLAITEKAASQFRTAPSVKDPLTRDPLNLFAKGVLPPLRCAKV